MRTYTEVAMIVNGNKTCRLDIFSEGNRFDIYEHDENVYSGGWLGMDEYLKKWKAKWQPMVEVLTAEGMQVEWATTR